MRRCKHPLHRRYVRNEPCAVRGPTVFVQTSHCLDCLENFSLGESNDLGQHAAFVRIEIRAAEIAATAYEQRDRLGVWRVDAMTSHEADGVFSDLDDHPFLCDENEAGYLARCIATHKDPQ